MDGWERDMSMKGKRVGHGRSEPDEGGERQRDAVRTQNLKPVSA